MIYEMVLISPTEILETVARREGYQRNYPKSRSYYGPHHYLLIVDPKDSSSTKPPSETPEFLSLSLLSTCRQIYQETRSMFWTRNTFYFPSPDALISAFPHHGFSPLRNMSSILLGAGDEIYSNIQSFRAAIGVLNKHSASSDQLQHVELFFRAPEIMDFAKRLRIARGRPMLHYHRKGAYNDIIAAILEVAQSTSFKRTMICGLGGWEDNKPTLFRNDAVDFLYVLGDLKRSWIQGISSPPAKA